MCKLLKVSRSGYHDLCNRKESASNLRNRELTLLIRQLHLESNGVYGARTIRRELMDIGEHCGRHRVARLMRQSGLKGCPKRRFRRYANSPPSHPVATKVIDAMAMVLAQRDTPVLHHSDREARCTSDDFRDLLSATTMHHWRASSRYSNANG